MLLTRISFRSPTSISRTCAKAFSTSITLRNDGHNILDVLDNSHSIVQSHPSNPPPKRNELSAHSFAKDNLPGLRQTAIEAQSVDRREKFSRQIFRNWQPGDVYAPHDLTGPEQKKWKTAKRTPTVDAFDTLGINPIKEYKNFTMMSEYMTEMGRIKHSKVTGLRPVNQRKIAKAIRRAIGLGLMPSVHRHPWVLKKVRPSHFN
ncbi:ribosomal protein S18 [Amniculicola lignicola CBS 123094]|uniref:Small ribosomal subunit protein bS18m n=1 Tax=Amniculicola lignicola CBS 123094 TaxID=1392246 RepID=A0A6A5X446_9PLEO|nr:ribosomal protein S18 [Amniculicola lignicola CBS 123094]